LLFLPDRDGDDAPDGAPEVVLDGWDVKAQHNMFNALTWGPDGWLYGCNGIMSNSRVGPPGAPDAARGAINCGVWRLHPTRRVFEAVAHGTTNPWGLDFDDHGEAFITNCVIPHLYRVVPGAHFQRMYGQDFNPHLYGLMETCADHIHWAGGSWQDSRGGQGRHGEAGGGHAHTGAMIYLGDNWPDRYRDSLFTCNLHGRRVNNDRLTRRGSGYVATHGPDFLLSGDAWFRGLELKYGPDGSVFLTDWSDTGECHETDADGAHRENGRIYKISYGPARPVAVDLAKLGDEELVRLQLHKNDWYVRTARRLLQERAAAGSDMGPAHRALGRSSAPTPTSPASSARCGRSTRPPAWTRPPCGRCSTTRASTSGAGRSACWATGEGPRRPPPRSSRRWPAPTRRPWSGSPWPRPCSACPWRLAGRSPRAWSAAATTPATGAAADGLVRHRAAGAGRPSRAAALAAVCRVPIVRRYLARRIVSADAVAGQAALMPRLAQGDDPASQGDVLSGILDALRGRKVAPMPGAWPAAFERLSRSPDPGVRQRAILLSLFYGGDLAVALAQAAVTDPAAEPAWRRSALEALVERRVTRLAPWLQALLDDPALRGPALRALAAYDDPATPQVILRRYGALSEAERDDAVTTLASRPAFARALLDAVAAGTVPPPRPLRHHRAAVAVLRRPQLAERLHEVWGSTRPTSGEKAALLARYKSLLTPERRKEADPARGTARLQPDVPPVPPALRRRRRRRADLTGSDRANLDYILENVLDPGATVGRTTRCHRGDRRRRLISASSASNPRRPWSSRRQRAHRPDSARTVRG
jgi:putative membrane-bound dehydrogenase-like protein